MTRRLSVILLMLSIVAIAQTAQAATGMAVTIGLDSIDPAYYGSAATLQGCEADATALAALARDEGFNVTSLLTRQATIANTKAAIHAAAIKLVAGDFFLISYAGHGDRVPVDDTTENGFSNTWCLFDGEFLNKELGLALKEFAAGVRVLILDDECHSGLMVYEALNTPSERAIKTRDFMGVAALDAQTSKTVTSRDLQHPAIFVRLLPDANHERVRLTAGADLRARDKALGITHTSLNASIPASIIQLAACTDEGLAYGDANHGFFTAAVLEVWHGGSFKGTYNTFFAAVAASTRQHSQQLQDPQRHTAGAASPTFEAETPFSIKSVTGGGVEPPAPPTATKTTATLQVGSPLLIWDFRKGEAEVKYQKAPTKELVDGLNQVAAGCEPTTAIPDEITGDPLLSLSPFGGYRLWESASKGLQIAILYKEQSGKLTPEYSFTLTNLNPRIEDQLGTLIGIFARGGCTPFTTFKVLLKFYTSTSAWADLAGTVTSPEGKKQSVDFVFGPQYHFLLPGSLAITSVKQVKYNSTTHELEPTDSPLIGYVGLGWAFNDVYKFSPVIQGFVSTQSHPFDSFGIAAGFHLFHLNLGNIGINLDQFGVYYGLVWSKIATGATTTGYSAKPRVMLSYDLASLVKILKASKGTSDSKPASDGAAK